MKEFFDISMFFQSLQMYASLACQLLMCHCSRLYHYFYPERAYNITFKRVDDNGLQLVTYLYRGRPYKGHLPPGHQCADRPWYLGARMTLKRPTKAFDASGRDLSNEMKQFWGPCGDWNRSIGLCVALEQFDAPVIVRFNDMSTVTLTESQSV